MEGAMSRQSKQDKRPSVETLKEPSQMLRCPDSAFYMIRPTDLQLPLSDVKATPRATTEHSTRRHNKSTNRQHNESVTQKKSAPNTVKKSMDKIMSPTESKINVTSSPRGRKLLATTMFHNNQLGSVLKVDKMSMFSDDINPKQASPQLQNRDLDTVRTFEGQKHQPPQVYHRSPNAKSPAPHTVLNLDFKQDSSHSNVSNTPFTRKDYWQLMLRKDSKFLSPRNIGASPLSQQVSY